MISFTSQGGSSHCSGARVTIDHLAVCNNNVSTGASAGAMGAGEVCVGSFSSLNGDSLGGGRSSGCVRLQRSVSINSYTTKKKRCVISLIATRIAAYT